MKIAHISDTHINSGIKDSNIDKVGFLLHHILKQNVDHIVISGDVSDDADVHDLHILRDMLIELDIYDPAMVSVVIGNHDIFGGIQKIEDVFAFPERCRTTDYQKKIDDFQDCFQRLFENCWYYSTGQHYPFAKIFDDTILIGLNSNMHYSSMKNPFASNGFFNPEQLEELDKLFLSIPEKIKHRIILTHHHFYKFASNVDKTSPSIWQKIEKQTMKIKKKKRVMKVLKKYDVDLIMHGHVHESVNYEYKNILCSNAGGSIKNNKEHFMKMNIVSLDNNNIEVEVSDVAFDPNFSFTFQHQYASSTSALNVGDIY